MVKFEMLEGSMEVELGTPSAFPAFTVTPPAQGELTLDLSYGQVMRIQKFGQVVWLQAAREEEDSFILEIGTRSLLGAPIEAIGVKVTGATLAWSDDSVFDAEELEREAKEQMEHAARAAYASLMAQVG